MKAVEFGVKRKNTSLAPVNDRPEHHSPVTQASDCFLSKSVWYSIACEVLNRSSWLSVFEGNSVHDHHYPHKHERPAIPGGRSDLFSWQLNSRLLVRWIGIGGLVVRSRELIVIGGIVELSWIGISQLGNAFF